MALRDHPYFRELLSLRLPVDDYVIAGSAPLMAHGIERELGDIDVVARGAAWKISLEFGETSEAPFGSARRVTLFGGVIEVLDRWFDYSVDALISGAEFIEGVPFVSLDTTLDWKIELDREVDREDAALIRRHLRRT